MTDYLADVKRGIAEAFSNVYEHEIIPEEISLQETKPNFEGDFTLVVFSYTKALRQKPEQIGEALGAWIKEHRSDVVTDYNVVKGFLNFSMPDVFWERSLHQLVGQNSLGLSAEEPAKVLVEYSSPNTNKPLHLGHIRNILLGWSTYKILSAVGHDVQKTKIVNDRGIAVCKSMLAWQLVGDGDTPVSTGIKGDHFVGRYYVKFDQLFQEEYKEWQDTAEARAIYQARADKEQSAESYFKKYKNDYFNKYSNLGNQAKEMLIAWEQNDPNIRALWSKMNDWVYDGFNETYKKLGVDFDFIDYESNTYVLGKDIISDGLKANAFYQKEDSSVWVDLEDKGLDQKILLRSDGTSVYITQDIGTARMRYDKTSADKMIYVVGDEQDYHFQVLFETLKKLNESYADGLYHLSYGMVDLPTGRMKSREGTVVDADDLIAEVIAEVKESAIERGELADLSESERENIYRQIGLGALKYFILKINPKKRMVFDPKESVDMQGQTGPYIQNAYVRIQSILRRTVGDQQSESTQDYSEFHPTERSLIKSLMDYPSEVMRAASNYDPSIMASYAYELAKKYHKFYHDVRILSAETEAAKAFRLRLSAQVAKTLEHAMDLLGIEMPMRM